MVSGRGLRFACYWQSPDFNGQNYSFPFQGLGALPRDGAKWQPDKWKPGPGQGGQRWMHRHRESILPLYQGVGQSWTGTQREQSDTIRTPLTARMPIGPRIENPSPVPPPCHGICLRKPPIIHGSTAESHRRRCNLFA